MLCFEVRVNGALVSTMGHDELATMSVTLEYIPELPSLELSSLGCLRKVTAPEDVVSWFEPVSQLAAGVEVAIRVVESSKSDTPIRPRLTRDYPVPTRYCAFCGRSSSEGKRMVGGPLFICEPCVAECHNVLAKG